MKRFTETEKWRDTWFRQLKPLHKLAFMYIVDTCDAAGVWDPDFEFANFAIGAQIEWSALPKQEFSDRIEILPNGKWYLTRFVDFQYGKLTAECRPHQRVLQLLQTHGIGYEKGIQRVSIPTRQDRIGKDRIGSGVGVQGKGITAEQIYAVYPRKVAKQDALRAINKAMQQLAPEKLLSATEAYASATEKWSAHDRQFIPHPATWYNRGSYEDDPSTWARGKVNGNDKGKALFA